MLVNTKIYTESAEALERGMNTGLYKIYSKREIGYNAITVKIEQESVYVKIKKAIGFKGDITEYMKGVTKIEIQEYSNRIRIRLFTLKNDEDKKEEMFAEYSFDTVTLEKGKMKNKTLGIRYCTGKNNDVCLYFEIYELSILGDGFTNQMIGNSANSRLQMEEKVNELRKEGKIAIRQEVIGDMCRTSVIALSNSIRFNGAGTRAWKMEITERCGKLTIKYYDITEKMLKCEDVDGSIVLRKTGLLVNTIKYTRAGKMLLSKKWEFLDSNPSLLAHLQRLSMSPNNPLK